MRCEKRAMMLGVCVVLGCRETGVDAVPGGTTGDTNPEATLSTPYGDGVLVECLKRSACSEEYSLNVCVENFLWDDDGFSLESTSMKHQYFQRMACVADAPDCVSLQACIDDTYDAYFDAIEPEACLGYPEFRCEDDKVIWCLGYDGDEATEPTRLVYDLSEMDKVCNAAGSYAADPGHAACDEADYPEGERCVGPLYETCIDGEILTYDCRHSDPDFVCTMREGDQGLCTLPAVSPECEGITSDLHVSAGRCNGDVAEFCVSGKFFEVDCSAFNEGTCSTDESEWVYCAGAPSYCWGGEGCECYADMSCDIGLVCVENRCESVRPDAGV